MSKTLLCLALVIHNEARGEPELGKKAVAYTVINRAEQMNKPICNVVYQPAQYYTKPVKDKKSKAWKESKEVARKVLSKKVRDPTKGATHFHNSTVRPKWKLRKTQKVGKHTFYKKK